MLAMGDGMVGVLPFLCGSAKWLHCWPSQMSLDAI